MTRKNPLAGQRFLTEDALALVMNASIFELKMKSDNTNIRIILKSMLSIKNRSSNKPEIICTLTPSGTLKTNYVHV